MYFAIQVPLTLGDNWQGHHISNKLSNQIAKIESAGITIPNAAQWPEEGKQYACPDTMLEAFAKQVQESADILQRNLK